VTTREIECVGKLERTTELATEDSKFYPLKLWPVPPLVSFIALLYIFFPLVFLHQHNFKSIWLFFFFYLTTEQTFPCGIISCCWKMATHLHTDPFFIWFDNNIASNFSNTAILASVSIWHCHSHKKHTSHPSKLCRGYWGIIMLHLLWF